MLSVEVSSGLVAVHRLLAIVLTHGWLLVKSGVVHKFVARRCELRVILHVPRLRVDLPRLCLLETVDVVLVLFLFAFLYLFLKVLLFLLVGVVIAFSLRLTRRKIPAEAGDAWLVSLLLVL